ncbi:hypothetical protein V6Z11_D07G227300 [Gossypium hirsutum]
MLEYNSPTIHCNFAWNSLPKTAVAGACPCPLTERASKLRRKKKNKREEKRKVWGLSERDKDKVLVEDVFGCLTSLPIFVKLLIFKSSNHGFAIVQITGPSLVGQPSTPPCSFLPMILTFLDCLNPLVLVLLPFS